MCNYCATSSFSSNNCSLFIFLQGFCWVLNFAQSLLRQTRSHHPPLQCYLLPDDCRPLKDRQQGQLYTDWEGLESGYQQAQHSSPAEHDTACPGVQPQSHLHPWSLSRSAHTVRRMSRVICKDLITPIVCLSWRVKSQCSWGNNYHFLKTLFVLLPPSNVGLTTNSNASSIPATI